MASNYDELKILTRDDITTDQMNELRDKIPFSIHLVILFLCRYNTLDWYNQMTEYQLLFSTVENDSEFLEKLLSILMRTGSVEKNSCSVIFFLILSTLRFNVYDVFSKAVKKGKEIEYGKKIKL